MPSNHTENYHLNQWSRSDRVLMEDFNADNAKIDAVLAGKAEAEEVETAAAAAQTALALGQAAFAPEHMPWKVGHYVGNGKFGEANPVRIDTGFPLAWVFLYQSTEREVSILTNHMTSAICRRSSAENGQHPSSLTWSDTGLVICNTFSANYNWNQSQLHYYHIAFHA